MKRRIWCMVLLSFACGDIHPIAGGVDTGGAPIADVAPAPNEVESGDVAQDDVDSGDVDDVGSGDAQPESPDVEGDVAGCVDACDAADPVECDDDGDCAGGGPCAAGSCQAGVCTSTALPDGQPCDDGSACTAQDECRSGTCEGQPIDCEDDTPCTLGGGCEDGECLPEIPKTCNDSNPCTSDSCDPGSGSCQHTPSTAPCDDGSACTANDTCADGSCTATTPVDCDDEEECTSDTCDPASGCQHEANPGPCDDGKACTIGDTCNGLACEGAPRPCDDGDICTVETCVEPGGCQTGPAGAIPCDDGDACTGADRCAVGGCSGDPISCDDGVACTTDACVGGACSHVQEAGTCLIDGACHAAMATDPLDPCRRCEPATSPKAWVPLADGTECPNGTCEAGTCKTYEVCDLDGVCDGLETCGNCSPDCGEVGPWGSLTALTALESPEGDESFSFSFDGLELYFGSMRSGTLGSVDLWVARRPTTTSAFGDIEPLANVNSSDAELDPELSRDGLELFFTSNRNGNLYTIQRSVRTETTESFEPPVAYPALGGGFRAFNPRLSSDGITLYFVRFDAEGRTDIWYAVRAAVGAPFGPPTIADWSGPSNELTLALSISELELYYSMNGAGSETTVIYRRVRGSRLEPFGAAESVPVLSQSPGQNVTFTVAPDGLFAVYKRQGLGVEKELWSATRTCSTP